MRSKFSILAAGAALVLVAIPVLAHHSFAAEYDGKPIKARALLCRRRPSVRAKSRSLALLGMTEQGSSSVRGTP